MAPFATFLDYQDRYDAGGYDERRISTLLLDASALIASYSPSTADTAEMKQSLTAITCAMVNRAVSAASGGFAGVSNYSEGAAGMSASVTFANPSGDLYLTASEKQTLGIGTGRIGICDPWAGER